jgi:aminopeptidase N
MPMDVHSHARPAQVRVTHLDLDLRADFGARTLAGQAILSVARHDPKARLVLDTSGLAIERVVGADGTDRRFTLGADDPILGAPLSIDLAPQDERITVRYATRPDAKALQWLAPEQTRGGQRPFLFTQGQPILTRSWIPLQDSPSVRITWAATIRVDPAAGLVPVMSARQRQDLGAGVYRFAMDLQIPSYLIALAIGELERREVGARCAVWAEPAVVESAAWEFADTERMLAACEEVFGPYRFGRYDVLVLPPSFPFGGMENPCLTFATPTILAGDRSLVALVAHELAHSWSGNLVGNATWRDFWLNEGFTVYLEQRIIEALYGPERARMEIRNGMQQLAKEMAELAPRDQVLHIDLAGRNPDDGMTAVPYDKGAAFLRRLEEIFGRERFDRFLRAWFDGHAFQAVTTDDFLAWLERDLLRPAPELAAKVDVARWVRGPGLPEDAPIPPSALLDAADREVAKLAAGTPAQDLATKEFTTMQWLHFLHALPKDLPAERLAELDRAFAFSASGNAEVLTAWLETAIRRGYRGADARLEKFLLEVGRRKYLKPLYEALCSTAEGKVRARAIYERARPRYHAVSVRTLDKIVGVSG